MFQIRGSGPKHKPEIRSHLTDEYKNIVEKDIYKELFAEAEGQHIYQYVGTVKSRPVPGTRTPLPFEVGKLYKSPRWQRSYKCVAIGTDQVFWESLIESSITFRTLLDGSDFTSGVTTIDQEYSESPGTVEYFIDETGV
jgi:hypothetical protein